MPWDHPPIPRGVRLRRGLLCEYLVYARDHPEQKAEIDATPAHLCRLGYLSHPDLWEYAFYKYSDEKYAPSVVASGSFQATPEQAFDCSAGAYLEG